MNTAAHVSKASQRRRGDAATLGAAEGRGGLGPGGKGGLEGSEKQGWINLTSTNERS